MQPPNLSKGSPTAAPLFWGDWVDWFMDNELACWFFHVFSCQYVLKSCDVWVNCFFRWCFATGVGKSDAQFSSKSCSGWLIVDLASFESKKDDVFAMWCIFKLSYPKDSDIEYVEYVEYNAIWKKYCKVLDISVVCFTHLYTIFEKMFSR